MCTSIRHCLKLVKKTYEKVLDVFAQKKFSKDIFVLVISNQPHALRSSKENTVAPWCNNATFSYFPRHQLFGKRLKQE